MIYGQEKPFTGLGVWDGTAVHALNMESDILSLRCAKVVLGVRAEWKQPRIDALGNITC